MAGPGGRVPPASKILHFRPAPPSQPARAAFAAAAFLLKPIMHLPPRVTPKVRQGPPRPSRSKLRAKIARRRIYGAAPVSRARGRQPADERRRKTDAEKM